MKMSPQSTNIKKRHSFYTTEAPHTSLLYNNSKSDGNILHSNGNQQKKSCEDYYKKYEHDEIPVKDDCSFNDHSFSEGHDSGTGDNKDSITNSDLDKLEMKILSQMSHELQSDSSIAKSVDSNVKLFKITVQEILDNFYSNMEDFERYKKNFNEILQKNKGDTVTELEEFINNIIQHTGSSDSSLLDISRDTNISLIESTKDNYKETVLSSGETKKGDGYLTNPTFEEHPKSNFPVEKYDTLNINLVSELPCLDIKNNDRNLVSETNFRDQYVPQMEYLASAENIKKLEAKKLELEKYLNQKESCILEKNIPVKNSHAKKNIHLNEDFEHNQVKFKDENKFFIFKICGYLCKKLRRI